MLPVISIKLVLEKNRGVRMPPVVLVTGGSGLVGQGIRWQVRD